MKEPFSEEILSAYLDGELSPDERARVERRLERDSRAREQVEDFRRLSQLFAGLSRTELPPSFAGEVLQLAERRMLIPDGAGRPARWRASRWVLGAASMAAAAALLLIIQAVTSDRNRPGQDIADRGRFAAPVQNGPEVAAPDVAMRSGEAFFDREGADTPASTASAGEPASAPTISGLGGFGGGGGLRETDPRLAELIQEINDSEDPENIVSAVTVYVVDRAEGLVLLQRSLEASNVQPDSDHEFAENEKLTPAAPSGSADDPMIYVVAEPEQIITAFSKILDRDHPELRVTVDAPIKVATLDRQTQQKFDDLMRDLSGPHAVARELEKADIRGRKNADDGEDEKPVVEPRKAAAKPDGAAELKSKAKAPKEASADRAESTKSRGEAAQSQDAPADAKNKSEGMRGPAGAATGRQFVGRAPRELEQRDQTARKNRGDSRRSAETGKPAARDASDRAKDQQPLAGNRLAARSPLVRVLIRVASESSPPAAARPAAKKSADAP